MFVSVELIIALAVVVIVLIKQAGLKIGHALVCFLFGFYLAETSAAPTIREVTRSAVDMIGSFAP
ncbi:hypothetical protein C3486_02015 [Streptomyces sp. Ru73]|uniref:hypothetical protein n=1 Tax=Streptomyces sp. Ru73 TaxID=2080748 RepID=UPI000CDD1F94|nr:hypothetical protein [Streptomyces sp. Ru73]POX43018.1 hypothetical protein C3486_02015 [Streptomyces sp. Ru73]